MLVTNVANPTAITSIILLLITLTSLYAARESAFRRADPSRLGQTSAIAQCGGWFKAGLCRIGRAIGASHKFERRVLFGKARDNTAPRCTAPGSLKLS